MSLISKINSDLIVSLANNEKSGASSPESPSENVTADDIHQGLLTGASLFRQSVLRLNDAVSVLSMTESILSRLSSLSSELESISEKAAKSETSSEERVRLNSRLQTTIFEFQDLIDSSESGDSDLLNVSDLQDILQTSGIDLSRATKLAETFSRLGGTDRQLGYERIRLADETEVNPLNLGITTEAEAVRAAEAFSLLHDYIESEKNDLSTALNELQGAHTFSREATNAFTEESTQVVTIEDAEEVAAAIVSQIKRNSKDPNIAEHSDLDSTLLSDLLG